MSTNDFDLLRDSDFHVGVIGIGVVGSVVLSYFESLNIPCIPYDKFKAIGSVEDLAAASVIFVCVPTPYDVNLGLDTGAIDESLAALSHPAIVVVKSTVLPGTNDSFAERYPQHSILYNPEFLREKSAAHDFIHPDRQFVGFTGDNQHLAQAILALLPKAPSEAVLPAAAAEMIKLSTNAFLAMKVSFANEIYDLCERLGIDFEVVKSGLYADERIGASHLDVFDGGYRGFGGRCLPKDSLALLEMAQRLNRPLHLLEATQEINRELAALSLLDQKVA